MHYDVKKIAVLVIRNNISNNIIEHVLLLSVYLFHKTLMLIV